MKSALVLAVAVLVASPVLANADLAQKKNCMACHALDKKLVGPSFKDIASKYAGQGPEVVESLTQKVLKGGAGVWGPVPMPANPQVSAAEGKQLVEWIRTVK